MESRGVLAIIRDSVIYSHICTPPGEKCYYFNMLNDIVYILGTGSRWDNNEIRYSLRSLKNLPHRNVYVIGESLPWFQNIKHIPASDPYSNKQRNAMYKLRIASEIVSLSDDFVLMNDDFFIVQPLTQLETFYKRTLKETVSEYKKSPSPNPKKLARYEDAIFNTAAMYPDGLDYSLHIPFTFNKQKLKELLLSLDSHTPYLIRTMYGNRYNIGGRQMDDVKVQQNKFDFKNVPDTTIFLSSNDTIGKDYHYRQFLSERFSAPSKYERPARA